MSSEDLYIDLVIDKKPYVKNITNDPVINLTGESGSGKSFYAQQYMNDSNYLVVDTDEIFGTFASSDGYHGEFRNYLIQKYGQLPDLFNDFDLIYCEILEYFKDYDKTIVIDTALLKVMKDISKLKGKLIVMRTSVNTCYERCLERYKKNNPEYLDEDFIEYKERKKHMYKWYLELNRFLDKVDKL